jgi:hypothetical protein
MRRPTVCAEDCGPGASRTRDVPPVQARQSMCQGRALSSSNFVNACNMFARTHIAEEVAQARSFVSFGRCPGLVLLHSAPLERCGAETRTTLSAAESHLARVAFHYARQLFVHCSPGKPGRDYSQCCNTGVGIASFAGQSLVHVTIHLAAAAFGVCVRPTVGTRHRKRFETPCRLWPRAPSSGVSSRPSAIW